MPNQKFKSALLVLAVILFVAPNCHAQKTNVWTNENIHEWIDSNKQKRAKRNLIRSVNAKNRKQYDSPDWFYPPQMYVKSSRQGQLGRMVFPAYKVMEILDDRQVVLKVTDEDGQRYLAVFDIGDSSRVKIDHRAHISPDKFSLILFERLENYEYRNSQNIRKALPVFKKIDPAEVMNGSE